VSSSIRPRVLIAEDYGPMATALARLLTPDCEVVSVVAEGRAAIDAGQQLRPDVMLIDLNLPDISGLEVCRVITGVNHHHPKVILMSGFVDPTIADLARAAGAAAFLPKAAAGHELLAAITNALGDASRSSTDD